MLDHLKNPLDVISEFIDIARSLSSERDLGSLLNRIVATALQLSGAQTGRIYILDRSRKQLVPAVSQYPDGTIVPEILGSIALYQESAREQRNNTNPLAFASFNGQLLHIEDIYHYSGFDCQELYHFDRHYNYKTRSLLIIPLKGSNDFVIGALQLSNYCNYESRKVGPFSAAAQTLAQAFASQAAVAIDNAQLLKENSRLIAILDAANRELEEENRRLKKRLHGECRFNRILVGDSSAMQRVYQLMEKVVDSDATIFLHGETGTGKEVIAQAIHSNSNRKVGPFIAQNCAALPENLLESELFGYRKGAFSGADRDKKGMIQAAHEGTLFLDEIGDMPLGLQAKVLRFLQEFEIRPLGSVESVKVNVRVIAATHQNLEELIREGRFREDLYYRLHIFPIEIEPLRRRREDIPSLMKFFLDKYNNSYDKKVQGVSPAAMDALMRYDYPGNVRELSNLIERAVLICDPGGYLSVEHFSFKVLCAKESIEGGILGRVLDGAGALKESMAHVEAELIERRLRRYQWNQTKTAKDLGISRRSLIDKMQRYKLQNYY